MRSRGQGWNKTEKFSSKRKDSRKKCERLRKLKEFFPEIYDTIMTERFVLLETTENKKGAEGMKKTKQILTLATTASLLMGSISVPAYAATTFVDINTVTWSGFKPFLNQAAELGLMSGYEENGKRYCKPRNNVTYCEAVQLMYSIMKAYTKQDVNDATVTKWKPVISAYNIPTWAYKATAYGLENSILTTAELNKLQGGTKAANREDVGVIFGKAMDTVKGYDVKSGATLGYADKDAISAVAALCEAAAYYKMKGMTLWDAMVAMYEKYGYYKDAVKSIELKGIEGLAKIQEILETLRNNTPVRIGDYHVVSARDYKLDTVKDMKTGEVHPTGLPASNVLYYDLNDGAWLCVRPSGTEPKIKFYYGIKGTSLEDADQKSAALGEEVLAMINKML